MCRGRHSPPEIHEIANSCLVPGPVVSQVFKSTLVVVARQSVQSVSFTGVHSQRFVVSVLIIAFKTLVVGGPPFEISGPKRDVLRSVVWWQVESLVSGGDESPMVCAMQHLIYPTASSRVCRRADARQSAGRWQVRPTEANAAAAAVRSQNP